MTARVFLDRHGDIRSGWRIAIFVLLFGFLGVLLLILLSLAHVHRVFIDQLAMLFSGVIATAIMTRYVNHKRFSAVGLSLHPAMFRELGAGSLLGFLMMTGIVLIGAAGGYLAFASRGMGLGGAALLAAGGLVECVVGAMAEEILFRGYLFQTLMQGISFLPAAMFSAVLFSLAHLANPSMSLLSILNIALAGLLLAFAYMKTRSLWLPFGIHFAWNFSQSTLYGLPTSGVLEPEKTLIIASYKGPAWLLGGSFGPEGGVLATIALVIGSWYLLKAPYLRTPEGIITLDSVEDLLGESPLAGKTKTRSE